jgi:hypothetical protein
MPSEEIILSADMTVAQLRKKLVDKHGECHFPDNILCAVNQEIANDEIKNMIVNAINKKPEKHEFNTVIDNISNRQMVEIGGESG